MDDALLLFPTHDWVSRVEFCQILELWGKGLDLSVLQRDQKPGVTRTCASIVANENGVILDSTFEF
jgi:hypothetical protein